MENRTIQEFLKRPIAYQPIVAKAFGSVNLAILWCQFYYWDSRTNNPDGWVYKTRGDVFDETGLKRRSQETARKLGDRLGVLESKRMGLSGIVHFRVDVDNVIKIIEKYMANQEGQGQIFRSKRSEKIRVEDLRKTMEVKVIFEYWHEQGIIKHNKSTGDISSSIKTA